MPDLTDLDRRLRALHETPPITAGEIAERSRRRRRARGANAAPSGLAAATVVTVVVVAVTAWTSGGHRTVPVVVSPPPGPPASTPAKAAAVYVSIALDRTTVARGDPIQVTIDIVNTTGHAVPRGADCNPPLVIVYLTNGKLSNEGGIGEPGCGEAAGGLEPTLSPGHHRSTTTVRTAYDSCLEPGGTSVDPTYPPPCSGLATPALPAGVYRTAVDLLQLPAGTVPPDPVQVTILPEPLNSPKALSGIPDGWGRVAGRVGPRLPGQPDPQPVTLTFTRGQESMQTTAIGGVYEIELPRGTWNVRGQGVCATGLHVSAGAWERADLTFPGGCQDLSGPPSRSGPAP